ncbi:transposase [Anatilimnocola floriformis]|uniref:transposase n=1 Tax=Anatilimnocola floriformis TaxID=2948575 RepID=UPI0020C509D5|nr:transposase [Anatilimnocola floriformis]
MSNEPPIAFLFTWSTYGTWLPGDSRGWVEYKKGLQLPDPLRELEAQAMMTYDAVWLDEVQRDHVNRQIAETCQHKKWQLFAANCRSNHVHAVVSASTPKIMRAQMKAWCSQKLNKLLKADANPIKQAVAEWWADRGSIRWIFNDEGVEAATFYVRDEQDNPRRFMKD